jgi:hypothetical protein
LRRSIACAISAQAAHAYTDSSCEWKLPLSHVVSSTVALLSLIALWSSADPARAETTVRGTADAVRVEAVGAPLAEILSRLGAVNLRFEGSAVPARIVTGTYSGSLSQVLARLLDGTSYVTRKNGNLTILKIINADGGGANAAIAPAVQQPGAQPANTGQRRSIIPESEL